jgi:mono/diheme cytochrome c family protein
MMKPLLFVSAVVLFGITAVSAPGSISQDAAPAPAPAVASSQKNPVVKPTEKSQARAKEIYTVDCAMCHGNNGNGKTDLAKGIGLSLKDWSDPKSLAGSQDGDLFNIIRNGKGATMPAEAVGRAKDDEVWNLILYIRALYKQTPAAAPVAPAASEPPASEPPASTPPASTPPPSN